MLVEGVKDKNIRSFHPFTTWWGSNKICVGGWRARRDKIRGTSALVAYGCRSILLQLCFYNLNNT